MGVAVIWVSACLARNVQRQRDVLEAQVQLEAGADQLGGARHVLTPGDALAIATARGRQAQAGQRIAAAHPA